MNIEESHNNSISKIRWNKLLFQIVIGFIPVAFLGLFYFYPLIGIFMRSFFDQGVDGIFSLYNLHSWMSIFSFENDFFSNLYFSNLYFFKIFTSPRILRIIWFTIWQASLSTLIVIITALPCAFVMGTFDFKGRKFIMTLATLPFVLPTIVVAAAFQVMKDQSMAMILLAHLFYNFSVVLRITSSFFSSIRKDIKEAGAMLGADQFQIFFKITLPMLKPAIFASAMLVFIFCFSSFGVILILGGPSFSTIEVEIYRQAAHLFNLKTASCLSLFQIVFTFLMMWIYTVLQERSVNFIPESEKYSLRKASSFYDRFLIFSTSAFIIVLCGIPMLSLIIKSLYYKGSLSFIFYRELFLNSSGSIFYVPPVDAISNSLIFASASLAISLVVGGSAAILIREYSETHNLETSSPLKRRSSFMFGKLLEPLFMLPLSTSAVTLGFGIIITLDKPPLNLRTSIFIIPILHTLIAFPFVVRAVLPALRAIPPILKDAAAVLGASPFKIWFYIELPIIARALSVGAVFAFTVSIGEFGASLFAARPEFTTMPIAVYKFIGQPGVMNYGQAMAMSSILMLVTASGFLFIENIRRFGYEGF